MSQEGGRSGIGDQRPGIRPWTARVVLWAVLTYPTLVITENLGQWGMLAGGAAVAGGLWGTVRILDAVPWRRVGWKAPAILAGLLLLGLLAAYLVIHPAIDTAGFRLAGRSFGASDADDAIEVALAALGEGRYPYRELTFLENPITPLPGSLLLAAPFATLGSGGLQNVFWLGALWVWIGRRWRSPRAAVFAAVVSVFLCPCLVYQLLQGTDYLANSIFVLMFSAGLLEAGRRRSGWKWVILWSACLGVALSSRLNFMVGTPLVFLAWVRLRGWRPAMLAVTPCAVVFAGITLPFFLVDPEGFSPLHTANKLDPTGRWPWLPIVVVAAAGLLAFFLGSRRNSESFEVWVWNSFLIQALLVLGNLSIGALAFGKMPWNFTHFGMLALPWGLLACLPAFLPPTKADRQEATQPESGHDSRGIGQQID